MVHGKFLGSVNFEAPVAANSCGTFLELRYFCTAAFDGVPMIWKVSSTSSLSTSLRTCSTAFGGE
ncbi:hypothetical protein ABIE86_001087 [Bradyrhizobium diazoefficiens]